MVDTCFAIALRCKLYFIFEIYLRTNYGILLSYTNNMRELAKQTIASETIISRFQYVIFQYVMYFIFFYFCKSMTVLHELSFQSIDTTVVIHS